MNEEAKKEIKRDAHVMSLMMAIEILNDDHPMNNMIYYIRAMYGRDIPREEIIAQYKYEIREVLKAIK